jgi:hypothetical protein
LTKEPKNLIKLPLSGHVYNQLIIYFYLPHGKLSVHTWKPNNVAFLNIVVNKSSWKISKKPYSRVRWSLIVFLDFLVFFFSVMPKKFHIKWISKNLAITDCNYHIFFKHFKILQVWSSVFILDPNFMTFSHDLIYYNTHIIAKWNIWRIQDLAICYNCLVNEPPPKTTFPFSTWL